MRRLSALLLSAMTLSGCLVGAPKMKPPEAAIVMAAKPGVSGAQEAIVAPLAFAAADAKGCVIVGDLKCKETVTMVHTAFLVRTGGHTLLIDAGLGADVQDWLALFPRFQRKALAVTPTTHLGKELKRFGVSDADLEAIVLTHAHWDHTAGLSDLNAAPVYLTTFEQEFVTSIDKDAYHGTAPKLLSLDAVTAHPYTFDGPAVGPFPASHDLFGDGTVLLLPTPGHTPGSASIFLPNVGGRPVLFVGDMVWNRQGLELMSHKSRFASRSLQEDLPTLSDSMHRVRAWMDADAKLLVVPSHDILAWKELEETSGKWVLHATPQGPPTP